MSAALDEFKQAAAELLKALPSTKRPEQVQAGIKCLGIAYLNFNGNPSEVAIAESFFEYVVSKANTREIELLIA